MSLFAVKGESLYIFTSFIKALDDHYKNNECIETLPCPILYHIHTHNIWVHNRLMVIVRQ